MTPEFAYFLKVNVAFALFYAFYRLFFYKDTFFKLRRTVLLSFFGLALVYPLFNMHDWIRGQEPIVEVIMIYSSMIAPEATVSATNSASITWQDIFSLGLWLLYSGVIIFLGIRFFAQLFSILWLARKSEKRKINSLQIYALNKPAGPFSFFKMIFVHPESHSDKEMEEILTHEQTHVSQWHSIDVMVCEFISIICWFNPFVWLLKREVRHNLEYLADNRVLESGYDSRSYQYHLLGLAHHHKESTNLYNSFNVLHLKNRIGMMNKKRSRGIGRTKYIVFIPLVGTLMLLSNIEALARITKNVAHDIVRSEYIAPVTEGITVTAYSKESIEANNPTTAEKIAPIIEEEEESVDNMVFTVVETMPQFPGGDSELIRFIEDKITYPKDAKDEGASGRVVSSFVVTRDGDIRDIQVIRSIFPSLDKEAVRIIKAMPKWEPGTQRGKPVNVKYTVPIHFRLDNHAPVQESADPNHTFTVVERMPQYPGGDAALLKFIGSSIKYPVIAQEYGIQGRVVVSFTVDEEGSIVDPEVIRSIDPSLDQEALRVVKTFPRWKPGEQRGKAVRVKYTVPIQFRLQ